MSIVRRVVWCLCLSSTIALQAQTAPNDSRAHGKDERVGVKQFYEGLEFQYRLIKMLAGRPRN
jgi:acetylornithine deacetylase/succinyl-diaminopimelate desuccinylase-like protein